MTKHASPEIQRLPLEELCLRIKLCDYGDAMEFLSQALDPPKERDVMKSIQDLRQVSTVAKIGLNSSVYRPRL